MNAIMEILKRIDGLATAPVSAGTDEQNRILGEFLPFKVHQYKSGREHNGWYVPQKWKVKKAEIRKDGKLIYDGKAHPLGAMGYSQSFRGRISFEELKQRLYFNEKQPDKITYHCDLYYKPYLKLWGFCIPYTLFQTLEEGDYEIDLQTTFTDDSMKVLEYTHQGKSPKTVIFNAHNCHAAQLNDGPAGYAVFMEVMRRIKERKTKYSYRLVIAPEHLGTVFYLADLPESEIANFVGGIFMEMVGHDNPKFALQESFTGQSMIDKIAHHVLRHKAKGGYWSDRFRKIVGNDETVWEAPGIEVPMISLSRCQSANFYYSEYHTSGDNFSIMKPDMLGETADIIMAMIDILEKDCVIKRDFTGLIALSNPKYDLYIRPGTDPSVKDMVPSDQSKWNYLMDCLPRYFNEQYSIFDIASIHDLPFDQLYDYLAKFQDKGLIKFVAEELI